MDINLTTEGHSFPNPSMQSIIAKLETTKFAPLLDRDEVELAKLAQACENEGFFYLDLSDRGSDRLFDDLERVSGLVKNWMKQPREMKCQTVTSQLPNLCISVQTTTVTLGQRLSHTDTSQRAYNPEQSSLARMASRPSKSAARSYSAVGLCKTWLLLT